jgi:hypothetical protein
MNADPDGSARPRPGKSRNACAEALRPLGQSRLICGGAGRGSTRKSTARLST